MGLQRLAKVCYRAAAGWLAAAGSASADAATVNAADIGTHIPSQRDGSTVGPENTDRDASAQASDLPVFFDSR